MATIEGMNAQDWFKKAKERQSKGQFNETGAREAIKRVRGRGTFEMDSKGQPVRGSYTELNLPNPPPEAKKPELKREVATMPKAEMHASAPKAPAKPAITPAAPKVEAPKPKTMADEGAERVTKAKAMIAEHEAETKANAPAKAESDRRYEAYTKSQNEKAESAKREDAERQKRMDERAATPGLDKISKGLEEPAKAAIRTAAKTGETVMNVGKSYVDSQARGLMGAYRYAKKAGRAVSNFLTGNPEAKKRLAQKS